jgi:hypothetical protein
MQARAETKKIIDQGIELTDFFREPFHFREPNFFAFFPHISS